MGMQNAPARQPQRHVQRGRQHQPGILPTNHSAPSVIPRLAPHQPLSTTQVIVQEDKKWGDKERDLLYKVQLESPRIVHQLTTNRHATASSQGLEQFGVGQWREISDALLPQWDETSLRIKAARLMGSQSLARYVGWKGDRYPWRSCRVVVCPAMWFAFVVYSSAHQSAQMRLHMHCVTANLSVGRASRHPAPPHTYVIKQGGSGQGAGSQQGHWGCHWLLEGWRAGGGQRGQCGQVPGTAVQRSSSVHCKLISCNLCVTNYLACAMRVFNCDN